MKTKKALTLGIIKAILEGPQSLPNQTPPSEWCSAVTLPLVNDQTLNLRTNYDICTVPAMLGHLGIQEILATFINGHYGPVKEYMLPRAK